MNNSATRQFAEERRARLAAERTLKVRQRDLTALNARLEARSRQLTDDILDKQAALRETEDRISALQAEHDAIRGTVESHVRHEERLWRSLQSIRDAFALYDADHRLICANRAFLSIFEDLEMIRHGIHYGDICQISIEEGIVNPMMPPNDWLKMMRHRWEQETIPPITLCMWDNRFVKMLDRRLEGGGIVSLGIDYTYETRIQCAIDAIPGGFILFDADDRVVLCNGEYRRLYALSAEETRPGTPFSDLLRTGMERNFFAQAVGREEDWFEERMTAHLQPEGSETTARTIDGRWLRMIEAPTPDGGRVGLRIDDTERKQQRDELYHAREAAEAASDAKSIFLANMSHELRTPLNGMIGLAAMLRDTTNAEDQRVMSETIEQSSRSLLRIIEDVLEASRIGTSRTTLLAEPFDPWETVSQIRMLLSPQAGLKSLDLTVRKTGALPRRLLGDAGKIRQILLNLVGNAVKFTEAGHVALTVTGTRTADDACTISISVEDTGCGAPPEAVDRIFQPFVQARSGHSRAHEGTGLGLSLCRTLTEQMNGRLWLDESYCAGARFCFEVTLQVMADGDEAASCHPAARPDGAGAPIFAPAPRDGSEADARISVLAAEDNRTNRLVLTKMLEGLNIDLTLVETGSEALAHATATPPDVILMDISMPGMDGKEATRRIRKWESESNHPPTPIIAMTAHTMPHERDEILGAGIDHFLGKPLNRDTLSDHIRRIQAARRKAGASGSDSSGAKA